MKRLVEKSRYLAVISVFGSLVGSVLSLVWGIYKTFEAIELTVFNYADHSYKLIALFDRLDSFLVSQILNPES